VALVSNPARAGKKKERLGAILLADPGEGTEDGDKDEAAGDDAGG
jgi:hypothetical protein